MPRTINELLEMIPEEWRDVDFGIANRHSESWEPIVRVGLHAEDDDQGTVLLYLDGMTGLSE